MPSRRKEPAAAKAEKGRERFQRRAAVTAAGAVILRRDDPLGAEAADGQGASAARRAKKAGATRKTVKRGRGRCHRPLPAEDGRDADDGLLGGTQDRSSLRPPPRRRGRPSSAGERRTKSSPRSRPRCPSRAPRASTLGRLRPSSHDSSVCRRTPTMFAKVCWVIPSDTLLARRAAPRSFFKNITSVYVRFQLHGSIYSL